MVTLVEILFWIAFTVMVYVYIGYPLVLFATSRVAPHRVRKAFAEPSVTIIIAAYNEASNIAETLNNKLALDYPQEKIQIIVVSDGSTDGTDEIVSRYQHRQVLLLRQEPRNGKTSALNMAVPHASGEFLVFADANSIYDRGAIRHLVSNFADPHVGYVTGRLVYRNPDGNLTADGCSVYMRYENFVRACECSLGSLVGVNGGIDAIRRSLYEPMDADALPDFVLPLQVVARGYRVVYEPAALLSETANARPRDEYRMRVRVALRALWTLSDMKSLFNVRKHGRYALQLLSHKALRYVAFAFMATLFVTAAALWSSGWVYRLAFGLQLIFLVMAGVGLLAQKRGRTNPLLSIPLYFILANAAATQAFLKFARGERHRIWQPRLG